MTGTFARAREIPHALGDGVAMLQGTVETGPKVRPRAHVRPRRRLLTPFVVTRALDVDGSGRDVRMHRRDPCLRIGPRARRACRCLFPCRRLAYGPRRRRHAGRARNGPDARARRRGRGRRRGWDDGSGRDGGLCRWRRGNGRSGRGGPLGLTAIFGADQPPADHGGTYDCRADGHQAQATAAAALGAAAGRCHRIPARRLRHAIAQREIDQVPRRRPHRRGVDLGTVDGQGQTGQGPVAAHAA